MAAESSVKTIDCQYQRPLHAAAFLLPGDGRAAFVENNTAHAVPLLLDALAAHGYRPEEVEFLIITHLHFDHASGTSALLKHCPNAQVVCHPIGVRHLVDPSRLIAGVKQVYGEEQFAKLYGAVEPIPAHRIRVVLDGETIDFGGRALTFLHTPGHAKHHICIYDALTQGMFTGDMFGIMHNPPDQHPCLLFSSAPTDFDPFLARVSLRRMLDMHPQRMYLTHFGEYTDIARGDKQLHAALSAYEKIVDEAAAARLEGAELEAFCQEGVHKAFARQFEHWGIRVSEEGWEELAEDIRINAMGLAFYVWRNREGRSS